ncbi:MAG TPA: glutamate formimidoyltransferase [Nitrospirales bacterium]|nr:glutamate formimidoyltransferase [Nitrospirales bacterium]HIN33616.1 glutamate formimidoyltransferase [Nitrospirales bacterium]
MGALIECVPNFSDGRNSATIAALVDAIQSSPGLSFLDRQSDSDHNRSVITFVGPPAAVANTAFQLAKISKDLIDLRQHQGVHPRIGSTDVIPFVPLQPADMDACVALAKTVGARIATELGIPVFLYEQAATAGPRALEDIRRGSLAGLTDRMRNDANWVPDFGERGPHPTAGVTAIGARPIMVAFNINLASNDLAVAKTIARTIRTSSGGFKHVKAMGVRLESRGIVQVSMNLTNVEETPIRPVFEAIKAAVERCGVAIIGSEIVGLVPERALKNTDDLDLQLEHFSDEQVLERRL